MTQTTLVSIVESALHPNYSDLYQNNGLTETKVNSIRKAISIIKKQPVKFIVSEFFYAFNSNYSGVAKSNLDVLFVSLQKYSPETRVIVLVEKSEKKFVNVLHELDFPAHAILVHPTSSGQMEKLLTI